MQRQTKKAVSRTTKGLIHGHATLHSISCSIVVFYKLYTTRKKHAKNLSAATRGLAEVHAQGRINRPPNAPSQNTTPSPTNSLGAERFKCKNYRSCTVRLLIVTPCLHIKSYMLNYMPLQRLFTLRLLIGTSKIMHNVATHHYRAQTIIICACCLTTKPKDNGSISAATTNKQQNHNPRRSQTTAGTKQCNPHQTPPVLPLVCPGAGIP